MEKSDRALIIIGGKEDRSNDKLILREVARRVGSGKLVVSTVAMSSGTDELFDQYENAFRSLGVKHVYNLEISSRDEAKLESKLRILDDANGVFFTGGDQVRITSQIGDTPVYERIREIYDEGGVIAGTSAGASAMSETMLVHGGDEESHVTGGSVRMAPGLGLIGGVIIDQHFMERGRVGRLIGAVAQNPKNLGIGIDEQTAIVVEKGNGFYVLGSGAVYVFDGSEVSYSNIAEEDLKKTLSIYDLRMHMLSQGDRFDLRARAPRRMKGRAAEKLPEKEEEETARVA
ncbi:MAG TPA: cyanophycinase [Pyrinomonadaceae bacterium]|nr:cyanophycinase [Pyrinomonadaceae bacterium]